MTLNDFKDTVGTQTYSYRRNTDYAQSFVILKKMTGGESIHIGDYTVLDQAEDTALSEKKVINLVSALNGIKTLMNIGEGTKQRTLFKPIARENEDEKSKIIFYTLSENGGVSQENAILTIAEDIEDDRKIN